MSSELQGRRKLIRKEDLFLLSFLGSGRRSDRPGVLSIIQHILGDFHVQVCCWYITLVNKVPSLVYWQRNMVTTYYSCDKCCKRSAWGWEESNVGAKKGTPLHGSLPCRGEGAFVTQWSYEPRHSGPPKTDESYWRVLVLHGKYKG